MSRSNWIAPHPDHTGSDWGGKFVGITKKTRVKADMALDDDHPAIDCFRKIGDGLF